MDREPRRERDRHVRNQRRRGDGTADADERNERGRSRAPDDLAGPERREGERRREHGLDRPVLLLAEERLLGEEVPEEDPEHGRLEVEARQSPARDERREDRHPAHDQAHERAGSDDRAGAGEREEFAPGHDQDRVHEAALPMAER